MANISDDQAPLLNLHDDLSIKDENEIPLRQRTSTIHCHVPDEHFDYAARNRLIAVLLLCLIFMIIEIIGRSTTSMIFGDENDIFSRRYSFEFNGSDHRCSTYVY